MIKRKLIKKIYFYSIIILTIAFVQKSSKADLIIKPSVIDFGVFKNEKIIASKIVTLRNTSTKLIRIRTIYAGCSCVQVTCLGKLTIPSHKKRKIRIDLNASDVQVAKYKHKLQIFTEGEKDPVEADILYEYYPDVVTLPPKLSIYGTCDIDCGVTTNSLPRLFVIDKWSKDLAIKSVNSSNNLISCSISESLQRQQSNKQENENHVFEICLDIDPNWPIGAINETLNITTNHPDYRNIVIPITGKIVGPIKITPKTLLLTNLNPDTSFTRDIKLEANSPIKIRNISSTSTGIKIEQVINNGRKHLLLRVSGTVPPKNTLDEECVHKERLEIQFDEPKQYVEEFVICFLNFF